MDDHKVFALDIGTRKIVGLVMEKTEKGYKVTGSEMREHQTRAMLDGQIHDVEAVAQSILDIKLALESKLNIKLESAAAAAAGRSLRTTSGKAVKNAWLTVKSAAKRLLPWNWRLYKKRRTDWCLKGSLVKTAASISVWATAL